MYLCPPKINAFGLTLFLLCSFLGDRRHDLLVYPLRLDLRQPRPFHLLPQAASAKLLGSLPVALKWGGGIFE